MCLLFLHVSSPSQVDRNGTDLELVCCMHSKLPWGPSMSWLEDKLKLNLAASPRHVGNDKCCNRQRLALRLSGLNNFRSCRDISSLRGVKGAAISEWYVVVVL